VAIDASGPPSLLGQATSVPHKPLTDRAKAQQNPPTSKPKVPWKKLLSQTPAGFQAVTRTIATYPEDKVELHLYVPQEATAKLPCILDIHGGGWKARQVDSDRPMMERLAQRGYVTAIIAYRLSTTSRYPAALDDCKAAVRYLRAHAEEFHLDPDRIGVMGGSAGGHLSGLLAMTGGLAEFEGKGPDTGFSSSVKAAIVMAATQDLVAANSAKTHESALAFFGASCADQPAIYRAASPITHVRPGVPPVIFIEGEKDTLKVGRAEMMEKLRALRIETAVHTLPEAPHPFWMSDPWCAQTVDLADAYFKKHL
jgi:acetyl esterase/lipase